MAVGPVSKAPGMMESCPAYCSCDPKEVSSGDVNQHISRNEHPFCTPHGCPVADTRRRPESSDCRRAVFSANLSNDPPGVGARGSRRAFACTAGTAGASGSWDAGATGPSGSSLLPTSAGLDGDRGCSRAKETTGCTSVRTTRPRNRAPRSVPLTGYGKPRLQRAKELLALLESSSGSGEPGTT